MAHALTGRWQLTSSVNFESYLKAIGVSDENVTKALESLDKTGAGGLEEEFTIDTTAKTIKRRLYVGGQLQKESPPLAFGVEAQGSRLDGQPLKVTVTMDGLNKIVRREKGDGYESQLVSEVTGDVMTTTLKTGSTECVRKFKKV